MVSAVEKGKLVDIYRKMVTIRLFEEKVFELYGQNLVPGTIHLYTGEEAVAVGVCANLRRDDCITSTHRGHGHCIAKGADLKHIMAEILGKSSGYCKGKGGSMHIADFSVGMLGATAVVGAGLPIAVGAGLSMKLRKTDQVVACFFGEGASNQGTFHESLNLASVWKLPVVFVCENNLYAMGTSQSRAMNIKNIADRGRAYGILGVNVDGNDVLRVYQSAQAAVQRARDGKGPTLIECKTYRIRGHHEGDPNQGGRYRDKKDIEAWKKKDPLKRLSDKQIADKVLTKKKLAELEKAASAEIDEAVNYANESPFPALEEIYEDVYV